MIYTVDRMEGEFAVLEAEDGGMCQRPLEDFPFPVHEGDKIEVTAEGMLLRDDLKQSAMARNRALFERLRSKKKS